MKNLRMIISMFAIIVVFTVITGVAVSSKINVSPAPNGITLPDGYKNWRLISSSHRTDNNTLRVILGNDKSIEAARNGQTNPWPDGSILAKLVWKDSAHQKWPTATIPGNFVHAEFMIKDTGKFPSTGGWGFARWLGLGQQPYGKDTNFVRECYDCHLPVKDNDYVFTKPSILP